LEDWIQLDTNSSAYVVKTGVKVLLERYRLSIPREDPLVLGSLTITKVREELDREDYSLVEKSFQGHRRPHSSRTSESR
jgi:hypothetical protein